MEARSDFKTWEGEAPAEPNAGTSVAQQELRPPINGFETASSLSRRGFIQMCAASALGLVAGCGTILHPERRGQPPGGGLDWSIVALDGIGLLLFFIPGVIAFAVDFTTGAIYLPPHGYGDAGLPANDEPLVEVQVPPKELTPQRLEQVASKHTGRDVRLVRGEFLTSPLTKLTDFWTTREKLASDRT